MVGEQGTAQTSLSSDEVLSNVQNKLHKTNFTFITFDVFCCKNVHIRKKVTK